MPSLRAVLQLFPVSFDENLAGEYRKWFVENEMKVKEGYITEVLRIAMEPFTEIHIQKHKDGEEVYGPLTQEKLYETDWINLHFRGEVMDGLHYIGHTLFSKDRRGKT